MQVNPVARDLERRWGYKQRPQSEKCYRQERIAILLSIFLGPLGVDQFYAHHWPLAVFKLLSGVAVSLTLLCLVKFHTSPLLLAVVKLLLGGLSGLWCLIDVFLWVVGGVYGTPGCPGGSSAEWQY